MSNSIVFVLIATVLAIAANAQQAPLRVRKNFSSLTMAEKTTIKHGIEVMKSRPANDPTSWQFQANIHGMLGMPTSPLHRQCQHGTRYFLVWHRGFLYYFEKILREASGDDNLTLPYWNWPDEAGLPVEFRSPANLSNALFEPGRTLNDGSTMPAWQIRFEVDQANAQFQFSAFQSLLENPHGNVHVFVGGRMSGVPTSANDPIFWLHHANVDRIWDKWLSSSPSRTNPDDSQFLNRQFQYADSNGQTVTVEVGDILSSAQLGYRYDDIPSAPETMVAMETPESNETILATSFTAAEMAGNLKLGFEEKRVKLNFVGNGLERIQSATAESAVAGEERILVRIKGIKFKETPAFTYGVYVNLPNGENNAERMMAYYVGSINFFGAGQKHDEAGHGEANQGDHAEAAATEGDLRTFDFSLDITPAISTLNSSGKWDPTSLTATLRPLAPIPPKDLEAEKNQFYIESANKAELTYERIEIVTEK